jgi:Rieske Fe-S protein
METDRRKFVKRAFYVVLAIFGLGFLVPAIRLSAPVGGAQRQTVFFPLLPEDELPRRGVKKAELVTTSAGRERKSRVFVVATAKGPIVLSATCSHLGCLVNYHKEKQEFVCPCHGGRYDLSGRNIAGPPPAPLARFPARMEGEMLMVGVNI